MARAPEELAAAVLVKETLLKFSDIPIAELQQKHGKGARLVGKGSRPS